MDAELSHASTSKQPRFRPLPTKMCVARGMQIRSQHGALLCVVCVAARDYLDSTEAIPLSIMTWKSKTSKRTILSAFWAEESACRDKLDLDRIHKGNAVRRRDREKVSPDDWTEEHLPVRVITDCKSSASRQSTIPLALPSHIVPPPPTLPSIVRAFDLATFFAEGTNFDVL